MYASLNIAQGSFQADQAAFVAALDKAHARSLHSYFTQYVLTDGEAGYIAVDEGDYGALPKAMLDRVIDTVPGKLSDEIRCHKQGGSPSGLPPFFLLGSRIVAPVGIARAFPAASVLGGRRIEVLQPIGHVEYLHGRC